MQSTSILLPIPSFEAAQIQFLPISITIAIECYQVYTALVKFVKKMFASYWFSVKIGELKSVYLVNGKSYIFFEKWALYRNELLMRIYFFHIFTIVALTVVSIVKKMVFPC